MNSTSKIAPLAGVLLLATAALTGCDDDEMPLNASATEAQTLAQASTIQGRVGGHSGVVWGHSVWAYADTVLTKNDALGNDLHDSSFSITDDTNASDGIGPFVERSDTAGAPVDFLAATTDESSFNDQHAAGTGGAGCEVDPCGARYSAWPGAPIFDAQKNRAFVFYTLVYTEPGQEHVKHLGQSLASWSSYQSLPERQDVGGDGDHPTLLFGDHEARWGSGAFIQGGTLYAFGCDTDDDEHPDDSPQCSLARVPTDTAFEKSTWRYYGDEHWNEKADDTDALFEGADSISVARNDYLNRFIVVYAKPNSRDVVMRQASSLTGPWSDARRLFSAHTTADGAPDAALHPEFQEQSGKIMYVSYSRPRADGTPGTEIALERVSLF